MLDEGQLLVRRVCSDREVRTCGPPAALLRSEWRIGQDQIGFWETFTIRAEGVAHGNTRPLDAMKHEVHQKQTMGIEYQFQSDESLRSLKCLLRGRQIE